MHHNRHSQPSLHLASFLAGAAATALVGGYYLYGRNGAQHRKQVERWLLEAKADILERMQKTQDVTEDQYRRIVDEVLSRYQSAKGVTEERAAEAASSFKHKWEDMREAAKRASEEARKELAKDRSDT